MNPVLPVGMRQSTSLPKKFWIVPPSTENKKELQNGKNQNGREVRNSRLA
ncbi:MAG: hypothetical protein A4E35_02149 [Methanoregula sp. PtaU1.Bin051]|nr:MAG: hypothetical protein A4E35_02149 [Methanoregula sp. PtaU1.Bin051]